MSERLLKFLLDELDRIRIVCRTCGAAVELPLAALLRNPQPVHCPAGQHNGHSPLFRSGNGNADAFSKLAEAIQEIKQLKDVDVHFILPEQD